MKKIKSEEELMNVFKHSNSIKNGKTIICCGHFLIVMNKEKSHLMPAVFNGQQDDYYKHLRENVGAFPEYTFKVGAAMLKKLKQENENGFLSILINDWQLVPPQLDRDKSQPNKYREEFYNEFKALPKAYANILKEHNLNMNDVYKNEQEFFFREVRLRDRFMRKAKVLLAENEVDVPIGLCSLSVNKDGNICFKSSDDIEYTMASNNRANCAAGVAQMMIDVFNNLKESITFINLMPKSCKHPVNAASRFALDVINNDGEEKNSNTIHVNNYFFETINTLTEDDFYYGDNCVEFFEFKN